MIKLEDESPSKPKPYDEECRIVKNDINQFELDSHKTEESINLNSLSDTLSDGKIRMQFIRKVYSLVFFQLFITALSTVVFFALEGFRNWALANFWLYILTYITSIIIMIALAFSKTLSRKVPINYILFTSFTLLFSYSIGLICSLYDPLDVIAASIITSAIVLSLTVYACCAKVDFTVLGSVLSFSITTVFVLALMTILGIAPPSRIVFNGLYAIIFGIYIIYDTQLIIGGSHRMKFSIDDYICASMNLYLDIIYLFLELLRMFGRRQIFINILDSNK